MLFVFGLGKGHDEVWKPRNWPDTIPQQAVFPFVWKIESSIRSRLCFLILLSKGRF